jgi:hypothetical protein
LIVVNLSGGKCGASGQELEDPAFYARIARGKNMNSARVFVKREAQDIVAPF